ncbi:MULTISPECIES: formyltransferase family protein [Spirulina sp. CCY15215]|uniref:formyltransferase family protein n=1 Tax=Spirulina sp. CCY15215 TaxID=2767591 RepID=UPI00194DBA27|nr:formyltransferase family protein [Spirulina major]
MAELQNSDYHPQPLSCFVIGASILPCLKCVQSLLDRGHKVHGFISLDSTLAQWSSEQNLPFLAINNECSSSDDDIIDFLSQHPFDYLFSIENYYILSEEILKLPRKGAINYHNSLLPKYAGCEVEYWAIVNREEIHGITWHFMSGRVDTGDIIKQVSCTISPTETAYSLNQKCDWAAVESFHQLIDELAELSGDRISTTKQNLQERTYYYFSKRPPMGCVFSWHLSAEDIDTFIRALTYISYENYVGTPKIVIENEFIIVSQVCLLNLKSGHPPGTIVKIQSHSLQIATKTNDILLRQVFTIDGEILPLSEFISKFSLFAGYQFSDLDATLGDRLTKSYKQALKQEDFWLTRLTQLQPTALTQNNVSNLDKNFPEYVVTHSSLPDEVLNVLENQYPQENLSDFLLSIFIIYVHIHQKIFDIELGYRDEKIQQEFQQLAGFFASHVPFCLKIDSQMTFRNLIMHVQKEVQTIREGKTYCRDIFFRYPKLGDRCQEKYQFPLIVERVQKLENLKSNADMTLFVPESGDGYAWGYVRGVFNLEVEEKISDRLNTIARQVIQNWDGEISKIIG